MKKRTCCHHYKERFNNLPLNEKIMDLLTKLYFDRAS